MAHLQHAPVDIRGEHDIIVNVQDIVPKLEAFSDEKPANCPQAPQW